MNDAESSLIRPVGKPFSLVNKCSVKLPPGEGRPGDTLETIEMGPKSSEWQNNAFKIASEALHNHILQALQKQSFHCTGVKSAKEIYFTVTPYDKPGSQRFSFCKTQLTLCKRCTVIQLIHNCSNILVLKTL